MNLHQSKFILSKDRMKFLTENLLPAWLCGRKWELLTSSIKQMSVEPPLHTCSVNSFFRENLYLSIPDMYKRGQGPIKGVEPSTGWKEKQWLLPPLEACIWYILSPACCHQWPQAPSMSQVLASDNHQGALWLHYLHTTALHQLFHTGKWLLLLFKLLPTSLRKKPFSIWRPTADKKKNCAFFFFHRFYNMSCTQNQFCSCTNMNHFILVVTIKSFTIAILLMFVELIWIHSISVLIPTLDQSGPYSPSKYLLTNVTDSQQHRKILRVLKALFSLHLGATFCRQEQSNFP